MYGQGHRHTDVYTLIQYTQWLYDVGLFETSDMIFAFDLWNEKLSKYRIPDTTFLNEDHITILEQHVKHEL